jgi:hypothetical protein
MLGRADKQSGFGHEDDAALQTSLLGRAKCCCCCRFQINSVLLLLNNKEEVPLK